MSVERKRVPRLATNDLGTSVPESVTSRWIWHTQSRIWYIPVWMVEVPSLLT